MPNDKDTINGQIQIQIDDTITKIPFPEKCIITKVYEDNSHTDIEFNNGDTLEYVATIGNNLAKGHHGILIFLNGSTDEYMVITK